MVNPDLFENTLFYKQVKLPDYYPTMYQDGYEPWQVMEAFHRTQRKELYKRLLEEKEAEKHLEDFNVKIKTEVKVR